MLWFFLDLSEFRMEFWMKMVFKGPLFDAHGKHFIFEKQIQTYICELNRQKMPEFPSFSSFLLFWSNNTNFCGGYPKSSFAFYSQNLFCLLLILHHIKIASRAHQGNFLTLFLVIYFGIQKEWCAIVGEVE